MPSTPQAIKIAIDREDIAAWLTGVLAVAADGAISAGAVFSGSIRAASVGSPPRGRALFKSDESAVNPPREI
jgi:hypothetical protein